MGLAYTTAAADIDHLVADDHAVVECLLQHLEEGRGERRVLADQLAFQLRLHAAAEEQVLYPALAEAGWGDAAHDAHADHEAVRRLLGVVERERPREQDFEDALRQLTRDVRRHMRDEETSLLPALRRHVGAERLAQLGARFVEAKRQAPLFPRRTEESVVIDLGRRGGDARGSALVGREERLATDASGLLDPQAKDLLDAYASLRPRPVEALSPDQARREPDHSDALRALLAERGMDEREEVARVSELSIPGGDGQPLTVRLYHPHGVGPFPVVLWVHSGGWVLFDLDTADASCRGLCNKAQAIVVSPDYRRAPEHPFPAAYDDVLATWQWLSSQAGHIGGDPQRTGIGGESVGGTMAAATVAQLVATGRPTPCALVCVYPVTTTEQVGPSMTDSADARPLSRPLLSWMAMNAFADRPNATRDPRVDLLRLPESVLGAMPPTLVIGAERDVLRSQGEQFAARLRSAGAHVRYTAYRRVMHEFFGASAVLAKAEQAQQEAASHFAQWFATSARGPS
jgi:acetyl esterase/lipase/hemerythrin superfamily protein